MDNKKKALTKAKRASSKLKQEIREEKIQKKEDTQLFKRNKLLRKSVYDYTKKLTDKQSRIQNLFDKKIMNEINKDRKEKLIKELDKTLKNIEIKKINILNTKPKGKRIMQNSSTKAIIDVKNVTKSYTTKSLIFHALKNVNFTIDRGEFVVILGPSGSGKSTLLNMISGLDRPSNGQIVIDGLNIAALKDGELTRLRRNKVGFVFQSYNLLSTLNVTDNIEIGRVLQRDRTKRLNIKSTLESFNILNQANKRTFELSGGQQQRVSIARAITKSPDILIGDEPTGALDSKSRKEVFKLFKKINKENKTTIIIVTHNEEIAKLANKVIKVKDGEIDKILINKKPLDSLASGKNF